jgi:hypothetical protein
LDRNNQEANAGAGIAAFQTGQYPAAERYLHEAVAAAPADTSSAALLATTQSVLQMDPFRPRLSDADRNRIAMNAFNTAGDRLKACPALGGAGASIPGKSTANAANGNTQTLAQQWDKLKPRITDRGLRHDPDLVNAAMNLAFQIERAANSACAPASPADKALLLIANLHEES